MLFGGSDVDESGVAIEGDRLRICRHLIAPRG